MSWNLFPVGNTEYKQCFKTYLWVGDQEEISEGVKTFEVRPKLSERTSQVNVRGKASPRRTQQERKLLDGKILKCLRLCG